MNVNLMNSKGKSVGNLSISDQVFGKPANKALVHQVIVGYLVNARQGTASAKTRGQVSGGGRKIRPQKHTGMARQGSIRAPHWRHGGVTFGAHPRNFRHDTPKKMRRMALVSTLSEKLRGNELLVLEKLELEEPKTSEMSRILSNLGVGPSVLLVADGTSSSVLRSARNIPRLKTIPAALLNALDLVKYQTIVMTVDSVRIAEQLFGNNKVDNEIKDASSSIEV